jgi:superfamily II DNA or RNA helicase
MRESEVQETRTREAEARYAALDEPEKLVVRAAAVAYVPLSEAGFSKFFGFAFPETFARTGLLRAPQRLIRNLVSRGVLQDAGNLRWRCAPELVDVAFRDAVSRKELTQLLYAVRRVVPVPLRFGQEVYENADDLARGLRYALFSGEAETFLRLFKGPRLSDGERTSPASLVRALLAVPENLPFFLGLSERAVTVLAGFFTSEELRFLRPLPPLRSFLRAALRKYPGSFFLISLAAAEGVLRGDREVAEEARARFAKLPLPLPGELLAWDSAFAALRLLTEEGSAAGAAARYEQALEEFFPRGEKGPLPFLFALFYPLARIACGDRASLQRAYDYGVACQESPGNVPFAKAPFIAAVTAAFFLRPTEPVFAPEQGAARAEKPKELLASLLMAEARRAEKERVQEGDLHPIESLFLALGAAWTGASVSEEYLVFLEKLTRKLFACGYAWLGGECAAALRALGYAGSMEGAPTEEGFRLVRLWKGRSSWEVALAGLEQVATEPKETEEDEKGAASKRLVWHLVLKSSSLTGGLAVRIEPLEQTFRGRWSKGRKVALKRLFRDRKSVPYLTLQDHRVCDSLEENKYYTPFGVGSTYDFNLSRALEALQGHPLLFRSDDPSARLEIVATEPRLETIRTDEGVRLRIVPWFSSENAWSLFEESRFRLRLVRPRQHHLDLARLLGRQGTLFPPEALPRLAASLSRLASSVEIRTDLEGVALQEEILPGDPRPVVQLIPSPPGFLVELFVRPLGLDGPLCKAGKGGVTVFGLREEGRDVAQRSFADEEERARLFREACPSLDRGEQLAPDQWRFDDPEDCLEFLLELEEQGDRVTVEWPSGGRLEVRRLVGHEAFRASLRGERNWFALSGTVEVDEETVLDLRQLLDLMEKSRGRFLPLGKGGFLALTREFRRRLDELALLGEVKGRDLRFSPLAAPFLEELEAETPGLVKDEAWEVRMDLLREASTLAPELPATFRGELRPYQQDGFRWLCRLAHWGGGACLADDMGLGKTVQALALLLFRAHLGPSLVVAPTSVVANWMSEAARFAPSLRVHDFRRNDRERLVAELAPFDVVVASYGLLLGEEKLLSRPQWNVVILDEAQAIKNAGAKRTAAAFSLNASFRMATTGTPVENNLGELWSLFNFLNPGLLGSAQSFARRFAVPIEKEGDRTARVRLRRLLAPFLLRRTKEAVLEELPEKTEVLLTVDLSEGERALYESVRRRALEVIERDAGEERDRRFRILAELMRLRRACCNPRLVLEEAELPSAKLDAFAELVADLRANRHRALVFSQFTDHLALLRHYLDSEEIPYQYLDGATPPEARRRAVEAFQSGNGDVFLISLRAGGTGLNLTAADYVIHMDPWWNPAVEDQASDRAHRIGQKRPVTIYRVVARNTVEEKILELHRTKRDLAEGLLEGADAAVRLSTEELVALFREGSA